MQEVNPEVLLQVMLQEATLQAANPQEAALRNQQENNLQETHPEVNPQEALQRIIPQEVEQEVILQAIPEMHLQEVILQITHLHVTCPKRRSLLYSG